MTGAGAPGGPGILQALKADPRIQLLVADADPLAAGRFMGEEFALIPSASDPSFIPFLLGICQKHQIDVVFPLVTRELFPLSASKTVFEKNKIKVIVSEADVLKIANDKGLLLDHLKNAGIDVPAYERVSQVNQLQDACAKLGYPDKPVVIKPCLSNGSRGVRILDAKKDRYQLLFHEKPNQLFSSMNEIFDIIGGRTIPELVVMEYLPGDEYTVDTLTAEGETPLILPRKRIKTIGGITVKGVFVENRSIIEYTRNILNVLPMNGPIGIQVKANESGQFRILEINPRIQGTSVAAIGAGVNIPLLAVKQILKLPFNIPKSIRWGTGFARYYHELFFDEN